MKTPVLDINQFKSTDLHNNLYVNTFSNHIKRNEELVFKPHSHNFYLCVIFTKGHGRHEIDFRSYDIQPGSVFMLKPGQTHSWKFYDAPDGFIFFHSREFYETTFSNNKLNAFPFYYSYQNPPFLKLPAFNKNILDKFQQLHIEYKESQFFKELKIASIINDIYIDLSRIYTSTIDLEKYFPARYIDILENFEKMVGDSFHAHNLPKYYADKLNISTKHLNRVLKETVNKTTHEMIAERVIIEAKKLISQSDDLLTNISDKLGFSDYSYFSKYFKSKTGITPIDFKKNVLK